MDLLWQSSTVRAHNCTQRRCHYWIQPYDSTTVLSGSNDPKIFDFGKRTHQPGFHSTTQSTVHENANLHFGYPLEELLLMAENASSSTMSPFKSSFLLMSLSLKTTCSGFLQDINTNFLFWNSLGQKYTDCIMYDYNSIAASAPGLRNKC